VSYYDPAAGADIAALFRPNTRAVWTEAPGSQTFEMQDIPAIVAAAHGARRAGDDGQHLGDAAVLRQRTQAGVDISRCRPGRNTMPAIPTC
jgi:O-acetylhomoserine/O-acetylserine sulfhydrylase-like pyridoxal-dependent enzyme